jgi:hypothetical protein
MHPGVVLYNSVYAIRWPGLDAQRFKLAWQRLVDSCDALRSVFEEVNGVPEQRVVAPFTTEVDCIDLSRDKSSENTLNKCIADRLKCPPPQQGPDCAVSGAQGLSHSEAHDTASRIADKGR